MSDLFEKVTLSSKELIIHFLSDGNKHHRAVITKNNIKSFYRIPDDIFKQIIELDFFIKEVVFIRNGQVKLKDGNICPAYTFSEFIKKF